MKAVRIHDYGTFENLTIDDVPIPVINENEILIKVHAASVNHIDSLKASGVIKQIYPLKFPWIPGSDFSGVVEAVGNNIKDFTPGVEVYGSNTNGGAYAEYISVIPEMISLKPTKLSFVEAASVPMSAETANQGLFKYADLKGNERILIHGAAGSVGSYIVQLAHQKGAFVATTASADDAPYLYSIGANKVIDYKTPFENAISEIDIVFDLVGGDIQDRSFTVLKEGGLLIATNQLPSETEADKHKVRAVFMHAQPNHSGLQFISEMFNSNKLKTDIAQVYSLEEAANAWINVSLNLNINKIKTADREKPGKKHGKHVINIVR